MSYNNLGEALTDMGWFHIDNIETTNDRAIELIKNIFDPTQIDKEGNPKIITERKTVIVADNHDFNETYLIDIVSSILKDKGYKPGDIDLVLLDNICGRLFIDNPKFIQYFEKKDFKTIEQEKLKPGIIVINPEVNEIVGTSESVFGQLQENDIEYILSYLDNSKVQEHIDNADIDEQKLIEKQEFVKKIKEQVLKDEAELNSKDN